MDYNKEQLYSFLFFVALILLSQLFKKRGVPVPPEVTPPPAPQKQPMLSKQRRPVDKPIPTPPPRSASERRKMIVYSAISNPRHKDFP